VARLVRLPARVLAAALVALVALVLAAGCGAGEPASQSSDESGEGSGDLRVGSTSEPGLDPFLNTVAEATVPEVAVFAEADENAAVAHRLAHPTEIGAPLVFLVEDQRDDWLQVLLPVRPNGSTGWVRTSDVRLFTHDYRITVSLSALTITVHSADEVILEEPVGIGTGDTPTPGGRYYIKELLQPPNPNGAYGPFAYGLSGFSNQLTSFAGGDGVIGIHGTNDPSSIGQRVSHGCIRMSNEGITRLAGMMPLGVPVTIEG
jgi:lipoprotein-anchoring transpeptidase ErfK/SrfK